MRDGLKAAAIVALRCILHVFWIFPLRREVFFSSYEGKRVGCNPESICNELVEKHPELKPYIAWCVRREEDQKRIQDKGFKTVSYGGLSYYYHVLTARVLVFNDMQKSSFVPFRKSQYMIQTWHGCGLYKKVGLDVLGMPDGYYKNIRYISSHISLFSSGCKAFTKQVIRGSFGYSGEVMEVGLPRNDVLLQKDRYEMMRNRVRKELDISDFTKIILIAPTFRNGGYSNLSYMEDPAVLNAFKQKFGSFTFFVRTHYMADEVTTLPKNAIDVTSWPDMQELLCAADILISDYSSCIWDFSLTNNPCFLYAPDLKDYKDERDFYLDIHQWPFPLSCDLETFATTIVDFDYDEYSKKLKNHFMDLESTETGKAGSALADRIFDKL